MCDFCITLKSITPYSVEYLGWITAIVGGIITFVTIIFTHYNERSVERSNETIEEINSMLFTFKSNISDMPYVELSQKFNSLIIALKNNSVYKTSLIFFEIILYCLIVLWFFGSLGFALNTSSSFEKVLIIASTIILISVFLFLPEMIKMFNKNKISSIITKDKITYGQALKFFNYKDILGNTKIITNLLSPTLKVSYINNKFHMEFTQHLRVSDYNIIYKLENEDVVTYISLNIKSNGQSVKYHMSEDGKKYEGVFNTINQSKNLKGNIYIYNNSNHEKNVFKLKKILDDANNIIIKPTENHNTTNITVDNIHRSSSSKIVLDLSNKSITYNLKIDT